jgi:lipoprotein-releasing system ATP-binding protein
MNAPLLRAHGLKKRYGNVDVLRGIDLEVHSGELVAILGASGSGKTTLLNLLGRLDRPDFGSLEFQGVPYPTSAKQEDQFRLHSVGFVFQFHHLLPDFTALENAAMPGFLAGKSKLEALERAANLLKAFGLEDRMDHKPNALSGGEQQRVAVARALHNKPKLLLADEPSGNLDAGNAAALHDLLRQAVAEWGVGAIVVTHSERLAALADRRVHLVAGTISE